MGYVNPQVMIASSSKSSKKLWLFILGFIMLIIAIPVLTLLYKQRYAYQQTQNLPKISISCPVKKELCSKGEPVSLTMTKPPFSGLAYQKLASGSAVLAVIPGKYSSGASNNEKGEKDIVLTVSSDEFNMEAIYRFKGIPFVPISTGKGIVEVGETVGWVTDEILDKGLFEKQYQLIISVLDLKTKEYIKLNHEVLKRE